MAAFLVQCRAFPGRIGTTECTKGRAVRLSPLKLVLGEAIDASLSGARVAGSTNEERPAIGHQDSRSGHSEPTVACRGTLRFLDDRIPAFFPGSPALVRREAPPPRTCSDLRGVRPGCRDSRLLRDRFHSGPSL